MKKFFVEHTEALITALVVICVLSLLMNFQDGNGNTGILHAAGGAVDASGQDFSSNEERTALDNLSSAGKPVIVPNSNTYSVNVTYILSDYISARDSSNNILPVTVEKIFRRTGEDVTYLFDGNAGTITFDSPGIYDLQIYTMDSNNKMCRQKISLAVNG